MSNEIRECVLGMVAGMRGEKRASTRIVKEMLRSKGGVAEVARRVLSSKMRTYVPKPRVPGVYSSDKPSLGFIADELDVKLRNHVVGRKLAKLFAKTKNRPVSAARVIREEGIRFPLFRGGDPADSVAKRVAGAPKALRQAIFRNSRKPGWDMRADGIDPKVDFSWGVTATRSPHVADFYAHRNGFTDERRRLGLFSILDGADSQAVVNGYSPFAPHMMLGPNTQRAGGNPIKALLGEMDKTYDLYSRMEMKGRPNIGPWNFETLVPASDLPFMKRRELFHLPLSAYTRENPGGMSAAIKSVESGPDALKRIRLFRKRPSDEIIDALGELGWKGRYQQAGLK